MSGRVCPRSIDVRVTWEGGDASRYAVEAVNDGVDVVVACGGDGTLNETERQAMDEAMLKYRDRRGGPEGHRPGREEIMKRFDADGDGELSETEREAMRAERDRMREKNMKRFDADGDGELSREERETMRDTLRDERPEPRAEDGADR